MISYIIGIYIVWVLVGIAYLLKNLGRKHKPVWYINILDYVVMTPAMPIIFLISATIGLINSGFFTHTKYVHKRCMCAISHTSIQTAGGVKCGQCGNDYHDK